MNLDRVDQIAKAVLYEGYMLYPYRPSSVKNRQRFNFGVLYPRLYSEAQGGTDPWSLRTECLVHGTADTVLEVRLRFLQLQLRYDQPTELSERPPVADGWQEALERDVAVPACTVRSVLGLGGTQTFEYAGQTTIDMEPKSGEQIMRSRLEVRGEISIIAEEVGEDVYKLRLEVRNTSLLDSCDVSREVALLNSLVSAHLVLGVEDGEFESLLEPSPELVEISNRCTNIGVYPVLVGEPGRRDTVLVSPIILYDYPQIAPESAGDLFDGTEIDEILSLRIMTLTDDEKREIRESDERARQILERTDNMPAEQFMKLHGAVRGLRPLKESTP